MFVPVYEGVSFRSIRELLHFIYLYDENETDEANRASMEKYVLPMQHNFENPLKGETYDTFIEYWIAKDERITQDANGLGDGTGENFAKKLATVDVRFVGAQAETWAKSMHHLIRRPQVHYACAELLGKASKILEYVTSIIPVNVDYYGTGNASIAFDLSLQIEYNESIKLEWKPLQYIGLVPGTVVAGKI